MKRGRAEEGELGEGRVDERREIWEEKGWKKGKVGRERWGWKE